MVRTFAFFALVLLAYETRADEKPKASPLVGIWEGTLKVEKLELRVAFRIREDDGKLTAKLDSIDQGAKDIPCEKVTLADRKVIIEVPVIEGGFTGTLAEDGKSIAGEFKQGGGTLPLTLKKVEKLSVVNRPQEPKKPYPYVEEEVTFENATARIKLAGTLTLPKGKGPFPALVLVTGSGPQDRNEEILGHKPFLILADFLTRQGLAVLRYDDRGFGKSGGKFDDATSQDFATDAAAAVAFLKTRKEIDAKRIGVAGHSEGGTVAPIVAADHPSDVAFIVLLAGPGVRGDVILNRQRVDILKAEGMKDEEIRETSEFYTLVTAMTQEKLPREELKAKMIAAMTKYRDALSEERKKELEAKTFPEIADKFVDPWMIYFLNYDPKPTLARVKCPVLAITGEFDLQVNAKENLGGIARGLKAGNNSNVTTKELPGLNHLFQPTKTGAISEYSRIETTFDSDAMKLVAEWILGLK